MANKETQELIVEAIDFYMDALKQKIKEDVDNINGMRKLVRLDDIKGGLEKKGDDE